MEVSSARRRVEARYGRLLTDAQRAKIQPLLPKRPKRPRGGRPRAHDRKVLEGILWILRSGARWQDLPEEFPSPSTRWRRLRDWEEQEIWLEIWRAFLAELNEYQRGAIGIGSGLRAALSQVQLRQRRAVLCANRGEEISAAPARHSEPVFQWCSGRCGEQRLFRWHSIPRPRAQLPPCYPCRSMYRLAAPRG